jgi:hypothetical protein
MTRRSQVTAASELTGGFLAGLKRQGQVVRINASRGAIFARVMVAARDARLSGAEWSVLTTIALTLQHLGRTRGLMSLETLADDCMVTERTVRNALRTLVASKFVTITPRAGGRFTLMLTARFSPKAPVPGNAAPPSRRRSAPRKKISTKGTPSLRSVVPLTNQCEDSAPRRESNGKGLRPGTAQRPPGWFPQFDFLTRPPGPIVYEFNLTPISPGYDWPAHGPPRKRAVPDPSG